MHMTQTGDYIPLQDYIKEAKKKGKTDNRPTTLPSEFSGVAAADRFAKHMLLITNFSPSFLLTFSCRMLCVAQTPDCPTSQEDG